MPNAWRHLALTPSPPPPPGQHTGRFLYGMMQPLLGARLLLADRQLLASALVPVGWLTGVCLAWGLLHLGGGPASVVRHFYRTFALLAPLPSVLLAGHYTRMVLRARSCLGLPPGEPDDESLWRRFRNAIAQALLIAFALAPATLVLRWVPLLGTPLARVTAALWALHWIVVDAFDATRVRLAGEAIGTSTSNDRLARSPWFVRALLGAARVPVVGGLLRRFARMCDRLALRWRQEIAVVEDHPLLVLGFALTTAALLATPVLNLFFRPIVLVGAVHVLGRFETEAPALLAPVPLER